MTSTTSFLLDVNVLVALAWPDHLHHARARTWFDVGAPWATCSIVEAGLVRLSCNRAVLADRAATLPQALRLVRELRAVEGHSFVVDDSSLADPVISLARAGGHGSVTDLHLVNLAATKGLVLATLDRRLPDLLEPEDRRHVLVLP